MSTVYCVGIAVEDLIFQVDHLPDRPEEKYHARDFQMVGGGCAATAAVAIVKLGGKARLAARVGDDPIGDMIRQELADYGVGVSRMRTYPGHRSSVSSVYVDAAGERLIVNFRDTTLPVSGSWLDDPLDPDIAAVLADSRWPQGAEAAFARARKAGIPAVLDADSAMDGDTLIGAATHVAFSAHGLQMHAQTDDLDAALFEMRGRTDAWLCVTNGSGPVQVDDGANRWRIPVRPVQAVDTLGAGDVWHGAFALILAEGGSERDAVEFASASASLKCTRFGGRKGTPTREETLRFLHRRGPGSIL